MPKKRSTLAFGMGVLSTSLFLCSTLVHAQGSPAHPDKQQVIDHWTPERRAAAIPRDLVMDPQGKGYLRKPDGSLEPYGLRQESQGSGQTPMARPPGGDSNPSVITDMSPAPGSTITPTYTFSAVVTDPNGLKSVVFYVTHSGSLHAYTAVKATSSDVWSVTVTGMQVGTGSWYVRATDKSSTKGTITRSTDAAFTVSSGGGGGNPDIVTNAAWSGGVVQQSVGRLYFQMPTNSRRTRWGYFVCSGTVVQDDKSDRSIILTAAHCVYDDANKAFARNVLFIPNQAGTSGTATDNNCSNDPLGCWVPSFGVVDTNWAAGTFPDNVQWDYAYYVVNDAGAHQQGITVSSDSLGAAVGGLPVSFVTPSSNDGVSSKTSPDFTHSLGYSYSYDPQFRYCAEDMTVIGSVNWWLPNCGLTGGASGGPWVQPMDAVIGSGNIISVNSWGYTDGRSGMAGPMLDVNTAECLLLGAGNTVFGSVPTAAGDAGVIPPCGS